MWPIAYLAKRKRSLITGYKIWGSMKMVLSSFLTIYGPRCKTIYLRLQQEIVIFCTQSIPVLRGQYFIIDITVTLERVNFPYHMTGVKMNKTSHIIHTWALHLNKYNGSVIKRQFRRCLTKPRVKPFSILLTVMSKLCLLLTVTSRFASQTRKLFIYLK